MRRSAAHLMHVAASDDAVPGARGVSPRLVQHAAPRVLVKVVPPREPPLPPQQARRDTVRDEGGLRQQRARAAHAVDELATCTSPRPCCLVTLYLTCGMHGGGARFGRGAPDTTSTFVTNDCRQTSTPSGQTVDR